MENILEKEELILIQIKKVMEEMVKDEDFTIDDIQHFEGFISKIKEILTLEYKPYLITWNINQWEHIANFIFDSLEIIGYEFIGNMDLSNGKYYFHTEDEYYDKLFKYNGTKVNYSNHLKIKEF